MSYKIKLDNFEGPLDLLLFFIHRDKLNIYDIPISHITNEFLEYLKMMEILNVESAGEFIVMASMLMRIKSKMLLPRESGELDDEVEDPRSDLVQKLLEYRQYKEASIEIAILNEKRSQLYPRGMDIPIEDQKEEAGFYLKNITLFDLLGIFKNLMDNIPDPTPLELKAEEIHLELQSKYIRHEISVHGKIVFGEIVKKLDSRLKVIVTFMAILELIRLKEIIIKQKKIYGEIYITGAKS